MCFSATGSFAISGVLTGLGGAAIVRNGSKPHRMFAAVPLLFAVQQVAEGVVWLTIGDAGSSTLHRLGVNAFLGFALVVWPTWLPFSLALVEQRAVRRRILMTMSGFGAFVSTYAALLLTRWQPIARVAGHSIAYDYQRSHDTPGQLVTLLGYLVPTVVPFFVSTMRLARTIGVTLVGSLIATIVVRRDALASVWCFFAAILSGLILVAVAREQGVGVPGAARSAGQRSRA